jgi:hypothetical protein
MTDTPTVGSVGSTSDPISREAHPLREAWAAAWFREYHCQAYYLAVLALDTVEEHALRGAWLAWWHANCAFREAEARLEGLDTG